LRQGVIVTAIMAIGMTASVGAGPSGCTLDGEWTQPRQQLEDLKGEDGYSSPATAPAGLLTAVHECLDAYQRGDATTIRRLTVRLPMHLDQHHDEWVRSNLRTLDLSDHRIVLLKLDSSNPQHVFVFAEVASRIADRCVVDCLMTQWVKLDGTWLAWPDGGYILQ
jgi:hypothetical protein